MKKLALPVLLLAVVSAGAILTGFQKKTDTVTVKLNEVVHSIFYAPQYVAIEKGYFNEEGLSIDLSVGQGADARVT